MKGEKLYQQAQALHERLYRLKSRGRAGTGIKAYGEYFSLLRKAAYLGHPEAQYEYGQQFEDIGFLGMSNPLYNPKKCIYWYTKASLQDHGAACNNLAHYYELGVGCRKDMKKAFSLYKKSAQLGYSLGKENFKKIKRQAVL